MGTTCSRAAAGVLLLGVLAGCGADEPRRAALEGGGAPPPTATPTASASPAPTDEASPAGPAAPPSGPAENAAPAATTSSAPAAGSYDLDGDGRGDAVRLTPVPDLGWSFDVTLADGRQTSAPLPRENAVEEDVEVLGAVDLDADGRDEVLVRTLTAVGGQNAVVFRLDGDGVWLVRTPDGAPWELSTAGGMSGPRSYACVDAAARPGREVQTRESQREETADGAPTYATTTRTWALTGHGVELLETQQATGVDPEQVALDPATC